MPGSRPSRPLGAGIDPLIVMPVTRRTGRVSGTVRYGELEIEAGGVLSGSVAALDEAA